MKTTKTFLSLIILTTGLFASFYSYSQNTSSKHTESENQEKISQLKHDTLPFKGSFRWTFHLGFFEQISTHTFSPRYIDYRMTGKVHSTDYRMQQLSYDNSTKKWIGQTPDGLVYALFFKSINDTSITIYKHKCKKGLYEAIALRRPTDDTTADHGWNIYTREEMAEPSDKLAFGGVFYNNENKTFELHDDKAIWNNQTYQKITHHFGERRWVGQNDNHYVVILYEFEKDALQGKFSIQIVNDVQEAYKLKHAQQIFTLYHLK